jgi:hypothetical protein
MCLHIHESETEGGSEAVVPPIAAVFAAKTKDVAATNKTGGNECSETML